MTINLSFFSQRSYYDRERALETLERVSREVAEERDLQSPNHKNPIALNSAPRLSR